MSLPGRRPHVTQRRHSADCSRCPVLTRSRIARPEALRPVGPSSISRNRRTSSTIASADTTEVFMSVETTEPITYVDSKNAASFDFAPGSRWKILFEDPQTGQRAMLVEWEPGYRMGGVDHHEADEIVFVLSGTFVQDGKASGPGTYIHHRAGSSHQASTPDGCTFFEIVTGHGVRSGVPSPEQLARFRNLLTCQS